MLTILKLGASKILRLFYENKLVKFHLREIARQTKMHEPSVTRFLNYLEQNHILKSEKDGNLKKYNIIKSRSLSLFFGIFDVERFEKLPKIRKNAVEIFLDKLSEKPIFVILFGSTAKNNLKHNSDIDLLIVTNNKISTKSAKKEVDALTAIKLSVFQITYNDFLTELKMQNDKVVQSALKSGYPLINHIQYYEAVLR